MVHSDLKIRSELLEVMVKDQVRLSWSSELDDICTSPWSSSLYTFRKMERHDHKLAFPSYTAHKLAASHFDGIQELCYLLEVEALRDQNRFMPSSYHECGWILLSQSEEAKCDEYMNGNVKTRNMIHTCTFRLMPVRSRRHLRPLSTPHAAGFGSAIRSDLTTRLLIRSRSWLCG